MAEVKFTIKRYNGTTFDIALPKTVVEQVIEINEHLKDGDRHISAEDREVLKTVATLSAKGYAPIRNSAMATVKEYPTYTALKNDLANLPQGTTAMVLDASDDVLVDYGYAMYRVMLDETDNKTLIKVSDTMSMDFVLKLDNVRGFNQSAEAVDKMVEDGHFHDNFALLNTLTQGMFEGLKDYQKAKTAFENTLDKVGLRSGDMAFVKVGNDPTVPTEEEHAPGPVVPPVSSEEQPVHNEETHTEQPQPPVSEETHTEQPAAPVTPGENTVPPQPEGTGETHTEQPVVPATPEETHENTGSPAVTPEENTATPGVPEAPKPADETNHTVEPSAPVAEDPGHTEEHKPVTPEGGNPDTTGQPTPEEHQPQPPVVEDTHNGETPANPTSGTEEKHEDAPVAEDTHASENTASPGVPEAPKETEGTNNTVEPSTPVEHTESPVVKPEDNTVVTPPEGTGDTHTETDPVAPAPVEETHTPEENKPVAEETHTEQPADPVAEDTHAGETPANPATGTEEKHEDAPVAEDAHTEHPVTNEGQPATPVPSEGTPAVTPESGAPDNTEQPANPAVTPGENTVTPQPEAEANPPASEDTHTEQPAVTGDTHTEENTVAPATPVESHENTGSPVVTPESGTPDTTVTPQPEAPVSSETPVNTGDNHTEDPAVNTGDSHSEESSGTPAVGTEENNVVTPVAEELVHTEVTPPPTPTVPEEHAHSETTENSEGTPVANTEDTSGDKPKPATPDDERFNSHLAVQPKPVENDLPEGVSPTSGNN
jgi:UPI0001A2DE84 related cluster